MEPLSRPGHTSSERSLAYLACLVLLLITASRLFALDRAQWRLMRSTAERNTQVPKFGNLSGIDSHGVLTKADFSHARHVLVFVLRADHLDSDVAFWNDVAASVPGATTELWGVCDTGAVCGRADADAHFRIIGFLDAVQMRTIANAQARDEVLLYDASSSVEAQLKRASSAALMSQAILQKGK